MHHNLRFRRSYSLASALLFLMLCCGSNAFAQSGTSTVRGTVADAQGNVVAGATVTLINDEKNFSRTQTTNDQGGYTFSSIPPDVYRVEAEAVSFKKTVVSDVRALVDTPTDVDVALEVGNVAETVDVSAATESPINTTDATLGTTFEAQRITQLPLNARNIVNLLSLQPGVTRTGEVNGGRRDQANITLDGVDANEQQSGLDIVTGDAFASVLRLTPDSVQEFRVVTTNANANQGRSSGAQIGLVTRSGTNAFSGSLYYYHRNDALNANDFFNNSEGRYTASDFEVLSGQAVAGQQRVPTPKLLRNIFGGRIGGPIIKDKLFFFYNYEGRRDAAAESVLTTVPSATLRQGIVRFNEVLADGSTVLRTLTPADIATIFPATGGVNPVGLALLQTAPLPNSNSIGDGLNTGGYRFNAPTSTNQNTHIGRLDYTITDRQSVFLRGNYQDDFYTQTRAFPNAPPPTLSVTPKGFVGGYTWAITNNLVNNFRAGLTRQAFTQGADVTGNSINFRFVYQPFLYQRAISRTTPVFNITDDISYVKGSHNIQFGPNIRFIRNNRRTFASAFDTGVINPSFYSGSGSTLSSPIPLSAGGSLASAFDTRAAVAAVLGRFSQYSANVNFGLDGQPLPFGAPTERSFATEEYEVYGQDTWRIRPNLTLTYGLRYGVSTPVYERNGFQVKPTLSLNEIFERRRAGAESGRPYNDPITVELAGKANNRPGFYEMDKNNFAPSIAVAYSPNFGDNFFGRAIGRDGRSVIRGGFRTIYDRVGSQLAVTFDLNNALGFASEASTAANAFNTSTRLGPLFTGLGQSFRDLPRLSLPTSLTFPLTVPSDESQRIEQTIDDALVTPRQYTYNVSYSRELPKGFSFEVSYVGRQGRNLLLARDVMHLNNLRDPRSGQDWYTAAGILADYRDRNTEIGNAAAIPYFENLFPGLGDYIFGDPTLTPTQAAYLLVAPGAVGGFDITDWTYLQSNDLLDDASPVVGPNAFFHPQYAALGVLSTVGSSDYHGANFSLRQRFRNSFLLDFNYTFAKSFDDSSSLESSAILGNLIRQPLNLRAQRALSDFDVRHNINANFFAELPFGRDRKFLNDMPGALDAIFGGFQMTGVFRFNTGLPAGSPFDVGQWATNWQLTSFGTRLGRVRADNNPNVDGRPNIFSDPEAVYRSYRNARAGEVGERNPDDLRIPSYVALDLGVGKTFKLPFIGENHTLQFRAEAFNVTNTQRFEGISALGLNQDPFRGGSPSEDFGRYISSQTPVGENRPGRVLQFVLRYEF